MRDKNEFPYDGYRTKEQRDAAMLMAVAAKDPSLFGEMSPENKEEYKRWVKEMESIPEGATVDVPYNFD